jgi:hypothetical protein
MENRDEDADGARMQRAVSHFLPKRRLLFTLLVAFLKNKICLHVSVAHGRKRY